MRKRKVGEMLDQFYVITEVESIGIVGVRDVDEFELRGDATIGENGQIKAKEGNTRGNLEILRVGFGEN